MKTFRKQDTRIPRRPLLWLAAALLFTLPPMFGTLPSWVPLLFLMALAAKFWMEPKGYRLRSLIWKLVLVALILSLLFFSYGSVRGMEPGVSLIILLTSVKVLETHTAREFHIMIMVAWILCLCGFFLSQNLAIAVCLVIAFALLLVALIQFHRGLSSAFWPPVRIAGKLLAQAAPLLFCCSSSFRASIPGYDFRLRRSVEHRLASPTGSHPGALHPWLILRRQLSELSSPMAKFLLSARCTGEVS